MAMSYVTSKMLSCRLSNLRNTLCHVPFFLMSLGSMLHVDFKKCPCRRVEFRGQGPFYSTFHPGPKEETELSGTLQANLIKQRSGTSKILKTDRAVPTLQTYFKSALCFTIQVYVEVYTVCCCVDKLLGLHIALALYRKLK